jgi:beta-N-acetylhexosaminidase
MRVSRGVSQAVFRRRRLVAAVLAVAVGAAVAAFLLLGGDEGSEPERADRPSGVSERASQLVRGLSTEELAAQVVMFGFDGTDASAPAIAELAADPPGAVLVGSENWVDAPTGETLVKAIREQTAQAPSPPLIAAAHEGGAYRAFADLPPQQTQLEIGDTGDAEAAGAWALETAEALRRVGFDLNLFPIADVATLDSPIADRAFSDDAEVASEMAAAAVRGCRAAQLACAAAHFPGLGAASEDTSRAPATVGLDAAGLSARDLEPFRAAFEAGVPAVVLSLAFYSAYDPVTPGALAEPVATGLLRDELRFDGLAITDDLASGAVRSGYAPKAAAVAALAAGADMVQLGSPEDQAGVREAIVEAVEAGSLPQSRLAEAAGRVLELKRSVGLVE